MSTNINKEAFSRCNTVLMFFSIEEHMKVQLAVYAKPIQSVILIMLHLFLGKC